jgi:hypothetical protein
MLTLQNVLTPFVIKSTLIAAGVFSIIGGVQQAALSFQHFGDVNHAQQTTFVQLAATGN